MQKREKMMLGLLAAVAVVAGVMQFSGPSRPAADAGLPAAGQAAVNLDEVGKAVEQSKLSREQLYSLGILTQQTPPNPFYGGQGAISQEEGGGGGADDPVFSGYIKVGQKIYAVINGMEYARGDELAEGGYVVQSIDKSYVVLERTDGSTGRKLTRRVPLVEDDTDKIRIRVVKKR